MGWKGSGCWNLLECATLILCHGPSNLFRVFGCTTGSTEATTLEASKNPMRYIFNHKVHNCKDQCMANHVLSHLTIMMSMSITRITMQHLIWGLWLYVTSMIMTPISITRLTTLKSSSIGPALGLCSNSNQFDSLQGHWSENLQLIKKKNQG